MFADGPVSWHGTCVRKEPSANIFSYPRQKYAFLCFPELHRSASVGTQLFERSSRASKRCHLIDLGHAAYSDKLKAQRPKCDCEKGETDALAPWMAQRFVARAVLHDGRHRGRASPGRRGTRLLP